MTVRKALFGQSGGGVAPQRQLASERTPFASLTPIPPIVIAKR